MLLPVCKVTGTDDCLTEYEKMKLPEAYEKLMKMDVYYTYESHLDAKIKIWKLVESFSSEEADDEFIKTQD